MDSVTIMLVPDQEYTKHRPFITDHHLTVAYYGRNSDLSQRTDAMARLHATVNLIQAHSSGPIPAQANGIGLFNAGTDGYAIVDLIDGIGPFNVRRICEEYNHLDGVEIDYTHGFTPHITREYVKRNGEQTPSVSAAAMDGLRFTFTHVGLWFGDQKYEVSL